MSENNEQYIIELNNVYKKFPDSDVYAVENFNLKIKKGEFVTFLGPSGCGKTTTLRMIAGFELPTSGTILLNGQDISLLPPYKRPINTVFQRYALFAHLNIYNNIAFQVLRRRTNTRRCVGADAGKDLQGEPLHRPRRPAPCAGPALGL